MIFYPYCVQIVFSIYLLIVIKLIFNIFCSIEKLIKNNKFFLRFKKHQVIKKNSMTINNQINV